MLLRNLMQTFHIQTNSLHTTARTKCNLTRKNYNSTILLRSFNQLIQLTNHSTSGRILNKSMFITRLLRFLLDLNSNNNRLTTNLQLQDTKTKYTQRYSRDIARNNTSNL